MQGGTRRNVDANADVDDHSDVKLSSSLPCTPVSNIEGELIEDNHIDISTIADFTESMKLDQVHPVVAKAHSFVDSPTGQNASNKSVILVCSSYRYASQDEVHMFPSYKDQVQDVIYDDVSTDSFVPSLVRPHSLLVSKTDSIIHPDLENASLENATIESIANDYAPEMNTVSNSQIRHSNIDTVSTINNPVNVEFGENDENTAPTEMSRSIKKFSITIQRKHLIVIVLIVLFIGLILAIVPITVHVVR
jgi:hypothetical protein